MSIKIIQPMLVLVTLIITGAFFPVCAQENAHEKDSVLNAIRDSLHLKENPSEVVSDLYFVSRTGYQGNVWKTYIRNNGTATTGSIALFTSNEIALDVRPSGEVQIKRGPINGDPILNFTGGGYNRISSLGSLGLAANNKLTNGNNADIFINTDGNVGIGVGFDNPQEKLQVRGNILSNGNITSQFLQVSGGGLSPNGDPLINLARGGLSRINAAGELAIGASNKLLYTDIPDIFISTNGNVGIGGIVLPKTALHVKGAVTSELASGIFIGTALAAGGLGAFIGTTSDANLLVGANQKPAFLVSADNRYISLFLDKSMPVISEANKNKYGLFVSKGILSEDYAIGPANSWADHVFGKGYQLPELDSLEAYILQSGHLPGIPSAATIQHEGYSLHDMNVRLLEKVEELTLYAIAQNKEIAAQKVEMVQAKAENRQQEKEIAQLKKLAAELELLSAEIKTLKKYPIEKP